jgi:aquaporin Z
MKKYLAEGIGTACLTYFACGVAVLVGCDTPAGLIATALAFGLVIIAMAYSICSISGCHVNPAVSIAMLITGRMKASDCLGYVLAQVIGAIVGSFFLGLSVGSFANLGANSYGTILPNGIEVSIWMALLTEMILTFIFVSIVLNVTAKKENANIAGIVIGLSLTLVHLLGISITGTSVNPARSLAPALIQGGTALAQVWLFILAPFLGSILAAYFYKFFIKK